MCTPYYYNHGNGQFFFFSYVLIRERKGVSFWSVQDTKKSATKAECEQVDGVRRSTKEDCGIPCIRRIHRGATGLQTIIRPLSSFRVENVDNCTALCASAYILCGRRNCHRFRELGAIKYYTRMHSLMRYRRDNSIRAAAHSLCLLQKVPSDSKRLSPRDWNDLCSSVRCSTSQLHYRRCRQG